MPSNAFIRAGSRMHRLMYGRFGGRLGTRIGPHPVLILTTRGRRSGKEHHVPLSYLDTPAGPVVIGSFAGGPRDPAWAFNLRARPEGEIRVGNEVRSIRAVELHGAAREAMAQRFEEIDSRYRVYRRRTDRTLPVFRLETA